MSAPASIGGCPAVSLIAGLLIRSRSGISSQGPNTASNGAGEPSRSRTAGAQTGTPAAPSAGRLVQRLVDEAVGGGVVLAAHVADRPAVEARERRADLARAAARRPASLTLYSPLTCLHDQLRVADQLDLARAELAARARSRAAAPGTRRRCWSRARSLRRALSIGSPSGVATTAAIAAGPGLPAGAAVDVDDHPLSARLERRRPRPRSRSSSRPRPGRARRSRCPWRAR